MRSVDFFFTLAVAVLLFAGSQAMPPYSSAGCLDAGVFFRAYLIGHYLINKALACDVIIL